MASPAASQIGVRLPAFSSFYGLPQTPQRRGKHLVCSFLMHVGISALVLSVALLPAVKPNLIKANIMDLTGVRVIAPYEGGGGNHDLLPASRGVAPRTMPEQITPPTTHVPEEAKLAVDPSVLGPPKLPNIGPIGDPLGAIGPPSDGPGKGGGIGRGNGHGVGDGDLARAGFGGVTVPRAVYSPDPEYSDAARRAKVQGTVLLWAVVGADGRIHDVKVMRALGMGLDEKAMEAVRTWKFDPARKDGQAVAVQLHIEVEFRLY